MINAAGEVVKAASEAGFNRSGVSTTTQALPVKPGFPFSEFGVYRNNNLTDPSVSASTTAPV